MKKSFEKKTIRIFAFAMAILIFAISFNFSAIPVYASNNNTVGKGGSLYGTGSANELNIVKLLDMALNRGGMSMSPATIKQFLEFWWDSVKSDLNTCIGNVDTSIEGTQAFVDALNAALVSADHYDKLGDIIKKYISFCMTLEYKSLSDFKQLLTQENTFRQFLLSYVADEDGNIVGTVDNKLKRYNLKSGLVNMVRKAADAYIEEYEGYYLVKTHTPSEVSPTFYSDKRLYNSTYNVFKGMTDDMVIATFGCVRNSDGSPLYNFYDLSGYNFVFSGYASNVNIKRDTYFSFIAFDNNWNYAKVPYKYFYTKYNSSTGEYELFYDGFTVKDIDTTYTESPFNICILKPDQKITTNPVHCALTIRCGWLFTSDGRYIKIWKNLDSFKKYSVGKSDIYYSNQYSGFDYEVDNSVTFDYDYYTSNNYSHTVIQNNIDNSTEVNETVINNIVNNYITNNYYGGGEDNPGGSGNWFTDLIKGIPDLLVALIDGLTGIISSAGELLEKLISLFTDLFVPTVDFGGQVIDNVNQKFAFKNQSEENVMLIFDELPNLGQNAPTITLPFSETTLSKYGVEDVTISFDWYIPYKPTVDAIFSAILWAMFAFNQYFAIKNIINASGNAVDIATRL